MFSAPIIADLFNNPELTPAIRWFAFTLTFTTFAEIGLAYFRIEDKAFTYLLLSLFKLLLQISSSVYFIVYKEMGLWGIIYSSLFSTCVYAIVITYLVLPKTGIYYSHLIAKKLIQFSLPIIYSSIGMYYMTFGDRYFLQYFYNAHEVGIYALGYKFGFMMVALVWSPIMTYWGAQQFNYAKEEGGNQKFSSIFEISNYILWLAATGIILFAPPTIRLIADSSYYPAIVLIPVIVFAYIFQSWTDFHRFGILNSGNTHLLNKYTWYTAFLISVLYILLIPTFGGLGAATATLISIAFRFLLIYRKSQHYYSFKSPWLKITALYSLSVLSLIISEITLSHTHFDFLYNGLIFIFIVSASLALKMSPFKSLRLNQIKSSLSS
jgi:O-antigen/teichoic acid export membrane protein